MKFFSLCLFILSSFFAIAQTPVPEQDRKYLQQEEDENGYGCVYWDITGKGRSFQQPDGTWVDQHPRRLCEEYCRPSRAGDEEVVVLCRSTVETVYSGDRTNHVVHFHCTGVGDTQQEAKDEALSICNYKARRECDGKENCDFNTSCSFGKACFDVDYDENDRPMIW